MSETLGQKQRRFTRLVGLLIEYAYNNGMELTFGDAYRDPAQARANAAAGAPAYGPETKVLAADGQPLDFDNW